MKMNKLAVITALMCCAASQLCSAQSVVLGDSSGQGSTSPVNYRLRQLEDPFAPPAAPSDQGSEPADPLSLDQPTSAEVDRGSEFEPPALQSVVDEAPALENPFSQLGQQRPTSTRNAPTNRQDGLQADTPVERGQPAGRQVGTESRSMAETIIHYGSLDGIADASIMPVQWPNSNPLYRSNPIGHTMLQNWCVQGLWYNYPAQRAAECARIQQQIASGWRHSCNRYTMVDAGCAPSMAQDSGLIPSGSCDNCVAQKSPPTRSIPTVPVVTQVQRQSAPVEAAAPEMQAQTQPRPIIAQQPYGFQNPQIR